MAVNPTDGSLLTSVVSGGGGGTQYQEGATTSPATGTLALARYQATPPTLTDGQMWEPQLDSAGNLKVTGSLSVGGTTDNSAFTAGTSTGTPAMGFYHSTIDTVTDGRAAAVAITSKRAQHSNLRDSSGNEIGSTLNASSVYTLDTISPDTTSTGSIATVGNTVTLATNGQSSVGIQVTGSFTGTILIEGTTDGSTWSPTTAASLSNGTLQSTITGSFNGQSNVAGLSSLRLRATAFSAGTATVTLRGSSGVSTIMLDNPIPTGSNVIGAVTQSGTWSVTATQGTATNLKTQAEAYQGGTAVSSSNPLQVTLANTGANSMAVKVDGTGGSFPISGTVTVQQATAASLNATVVGTGTFATQNTPVAPTTIFDGKTTVTTAGTRVALASSQAVQSVTIKALTTNTGIIYVGNSSVSSTNGFQLSAGDSVSMDIANLNTVNIDSSVNGEGVTYLGVN